MRTMTASALLALMQRDYPTMKWHVERYVADGLELEAVLLTVDGSTVHDPFEPACGRPDRPALYGLREEHARLLRRHNRDFAVEVLGIDPDLDLVYDKVKDAINHMPGSLAGDCLDDFGFMVYPEKGGNNVYAIFNKADCRLIVRNAVGTSLPTSMGDARIFFHDSMGRLVKAFPPT